MYTAATVNADPAATTKAWPRAPPVSDVASVCSSMHGMATQ